MNMHYDLKYGKESISLTLDDEAILYTLLPKKAVPIKDLREELFSLLDNPTASSPFDEIFKPGDKIVIVISDITRAVGTAKFLPLIVERLNSLGIKDDDLIILVATGTHRHQTTSEINTLIGSDLIKRIEVKVHNCDEDLIYIGTTSFGTRVEVNKLVTEKKVILTGGITHHLMAGYGGGRKSILPGVSGRKTIEQNHLHALDDTSQRSNPKIGSGVTVDNPINLDMIEACQMVNPDFLINSIVDNEGNILKFEAGHWQKGWEKGCRAIDEIFGVEIEEKADLVIASCGGYPKDISLYQGVKTLFNASLAVKPGGTILMLAECCEGGGAPDYFDWINPLKQGRLDPALREGFTIPGYIFYATVETAQKFNIVLLSSINPETVKPMGIKGAATLNDALSLANLGGGNKKINKKIIVIPQGGATIPIYK
ncbi:hypothetical protein OXPF_01250 [Oxobacter pfennigii]|uniref:Uncharacterized protein n=1 Tax=Oxobacter pfennigii TaxID=36849 RepID=A0A0N8NU04_9CLOT|nr:nickel-dependent lactate racemase [Oxobacter pfennigii]KPU46280.1 hypothetical protein OXPF_01250 [Oxobacter pfennigii]